MRDSSSEDLLEELDRKARTRRFAPWLAALGAAAVAGVAVAGLPVWAPGLAGLAALLAVFAAHQRDQLAKTVVLFYELDPDAERDYQALHDAFQGLRACARAWHVEAQGDVRDWKRNAGATGVVRRNSVTLAAPPPRFVKTNIAIPAIPVGRQTLYFFPDRLLVFESKRVGAVAYADLRVERAGTRFVEEHSLPRDATVVDRTWKYVNKKGGPDRRFKDNRELPIALYEKLQLRSRSGLNELLQFSKMAASKPLESALRNLAKNALPTTAH